MQLTHALLGFAVVVALLTVIPGLDTALVLRSSITRSRGVAVATAAGIQTGTLVWGAAAAVGATAVLAASETAYRVLALVGAGYLVWMGVRLLVAGFRRQLPDDGPAAALPATRGGLARGWLTGLTTNLLNPKVGVFYLATIPQFLVPGVPPLVMGLLLAGVHCVLGMAWSAAIIAGGAALGSKLGSARFARWADRVTGGVLVAFGARVALEART